MVIFSWCLTSGRVFSEWLIPEPGESYLPQIPAVPTPNPSATNKSDQVSLIWNFLTTCGSCPVATICLAGSKCSQSDKTHRWVLSGLSSPHWWILSDFEYSQERVIFEWSVYECFCDQIANICISQERVIRPRRSAGDSVMATSPSLPTNCARPPYLVSNDIC